MSVEAASALNDFVRLRLNLVQHERIAESGALTHSLPRVAAAANRAHLLRPLFAPVVVSGDEGDAHLSLMFDRRGGGRSAVNNRTWFSSTSRRCLTFTTDSLAEQLPTPQSFSPPSFLPASPSLSFPLLLAETKRGAAKE